MAKSHLIYDPETKTFRGALPASNQEVDSVPVVDVEPEKEFYREEIGTWQPAYEHAVDKETREEQYDPATGELLRVKVRKRVDTRKAENESRHIQFALWIFIGIALIVWIGMVSVHFLAGGHNVDGEAPAAKETAVFKM